MQQEVRRLHHDLRRLDEEAAVSLGDVHDPALDTLTDDGRTVRQALHDLRELLPAEHRAAPVDQVGPAGAQE